MPNLNELSTLIKVYLEKPTSTFTEQLDFIIDIENNIDNILLLEIDETIIDFLNSIEINKEDLIYIKKLIKAKEQNIYFDLSKEQKLLIENIIQKAKEKKQSEINEIIEINQIYKNILKKINNKEIIDEIKEINLLFDIKDTPYEIRNKIIIDLLKHNKYVVDITNVKNVIYKDK